MNWLEEFFFRRRLSRLVREGSDPSLGLLKVYSDIASHVRTTYYNDSPQQNRSLMVDAFTVALNRRSK